MEVKGGPRENWQQDGAEPDYRFSLANERTFLAWIRTALAMLAGAMLLHQFSTELQPPRALLTLSISLVAISAILSWGAYRKWRANEIAMRHARALPRSILLPFMAGSATALAMIVAVILGVQ
ncbi:YidH family protein [Stutzerimonas chloritidismutans]|uniref:YidH family protein n=1 Tax=Stutzerimonas chloritidismutans TaxID=203192 RepID=UPI003F1449B5